jgi:type VI secretion system protein VasI
MLITLLGASRGLAHGDELFSAIGECSLLEEDAARLRCFDRAAPGAAADTDSSSPWRVDVDVSPIDDSRTVTLVSIALERVRSGYDSARPGLVIRCSEGQTDVFIAWGLYLGLDETEVVSRVDDLPARRSTWSISTSNKATFAPGNAVAFARELIGSGQLFAQVTPYGENPVRAVFSTRGLGQSVVPLREACNW